MTDTAIRVENLGKRYQLGASKSGSFRESMSRLFHRNGPASHPASNPTSHPESPPIPNPQNPTPTEFWALNDINFEIKRGEAVGIIGRNGAGKSTLLKILSRITEPTRGRFEIFGRVSSLLEVGTGFHPELTGRENVYLNGTILGMKRREVKAKFDEIVAFSGVSTFIDTPVKHYSSGMQVRLAFAVAAHLEPEILIIDEVLAVGDAEFQKKCLGKMEDVTGEGRTVLFVSHNMGAVKHLCNTGILIKDGTLSYRGKAELAIHEYTKIADSLREENLLKRSYQGTGKVKFKSCRFILDGTSTPKNTQDIVIPFNSSVKLTLELETDETSNEQLYVAVSILDQNGTKVCTLDNLYTAEPIEINSRKLYVECSINKFSLNPGMYYCDLWCSNQYDTFQKIERAVSFEIIFSDYLGTGKIHTSSKHGFLYLDQQWLQK